MLKIKDNSGAVIAVLKDDANEPEMKEKCEGCKNCNCKEEEESEEQE